MKKLITILFTISLSIAAFCQSNESFDGMSKKEMRQFLLKQPNDKVQRHIKTYDTGQKVGGVFMILGGLGIIGTSIASNYNKKNQDEFDILVYAPLYTASGASFIIGLVSSAITSGEFNKAKQAYLKGSNPNYIQKNTSGSKESTLDSVRDANKIYLSIFQ